MLRLSQIPPTVYRTSLSALLVMYVALPVLVTFTGVLVTLTNTSQVHCLPIHNTPTLAD